MSDHYFSADPASLERRQLIRVSVWGRDLELETASGVFSAGRLDIGTSVLFRSTEPPGHPGRFLDLGCGYGVIACALGDKPGATVHLVESNRKKAAFLREAARVTGAPAVIHDERIEDFVESFNNPVDVVTARALVRPYVARNALSVSRDTAVEAPVAPGPTAVVLGHLAPDGSLRVGCVDTEDGAEALVRDSEDTR